MALKPIASLKSLLSEVGAPDRLTLLERLGCGGQAEVWLARDKMLGRLVTVKKVRAFNSDEDNVEDERLKSLRIRGELEHPAIPTLYGVIPHGDQSWLVSEYIEGVALSELLGELGPHSIYAIAKDLLSALRCLERLSLVHGDLSPNNMVIDHNGQVRLLDFESCSRIGEALSSTATIGFSAPERYARRAGLPTVDTWSIGAILIWLVTQRTPEIVLDDAKKSVSVTIGPAIPATDMLGDVINIAAAATRVEAGLRPSIADLEERLLLSYRWLEPVNRSALEALVRSRLASTKGANDQWSSNAKATDQHRKHSKSHVSAPKGVKPNYKEPRKDVQENLKQTCGGSSIGGTVAGVSTDEVWPKEPLGNRNLLKRRGREDKRIQDRRIIGKWSKVEVSMGEWVTQNRFFASNFGRFLLFSVAVAVLWGLYGSLPNWGQRFYALQVDTSRLSPATALPNEFSPRWVESIFSSALPDNWALISEGDLSRKEQPATGFSEQVFAEKEARRNLPNDEKLSSSLPAEIESTKIETETKHQSGGISKIAMSINCEQGACELLAELKRGEISLLEHTVILDTGDERIWRAAVRTLAQSIAAE